MKKMKTTIMALILALTMTMSIPAEAAGQSGKTMTMTAAKKKTVKFYKHVYRDYYGSGRYDYTNKFMKEEQKLFDELKCYGLEAAEPYAFAYICWASDLNMKTKTGKNGRYVGYFQFDKKCWKGICKKHGMKGMKITDSYSQIAVFCAEFDRYWEKSDTYYEALGRFYTGGKRSKKIEKAIKKMFEKKVKVW